MELNKEEIFKRIFKTPYHIIGDIDDKDCVIIFRYKNNKRIITTMEELDKIIDDSNRIFSYLKDNEETYNEIIDILEETYYEQHSKGGRKPKMSIKDKLDATIEFTTNNITYKELSNKFSISESNMYEAIRWTINSLKSTQILSVNEEGEMVLDTLNLNDTIPKTLKYDYTVHNHNIEDYLDLLYNFEDYISTN